MPEEPYDVANDDKGWAMRFVTGMVGVALLAGCSTTTSSAASPAASAAASKAGGLPANSMSGVLELAVGSETNFTNSTHQGGPCKGENGYDDIDTGAEVTVSDAANKVVGLGILKDGKVVGPSCWFPFEVDNLPKSAFYKVEVGHRGQVTEPADQIHDVQLTLGDKT